jgi:hypothetical protein
VGWMQGEQLPLTGGQGKVFLLTSPLIGLPGMAHLSVSVYVVVQLLRTASRNYRKSVRWFVVVALHDGRTR